MYLTELIWLFVSFVRLPELRKVKSCLLVGLSKQRLLFDLDPEYWACPLYAVRATLGT